MKMKKLCVLLAVLFLLSSVSGCANNVAVSTDGTKENHESNETAGEVTKETSLDTSMFSEMDVDIPFVLEMTEEQRNSVEMLFYLNMVSQKIESSKNNRLYLEEVYSSLLNDTNPSSVDKKTQEHLQSLLTIIKNYRQLELKREQFQYIYEQEKASAIKVAMPSPIAVLNVVQSKNWLSLATSVLYTVSSSFNHYKTATDSLDKQFIMDGWELNEEETNTIHKNRTKAFNYMVEIVRDYDLPEQLALNEEFINNFVENASDENISRKLQFLKSHKEVYSAFGPYWLEMAKCFFELDDDQKLTNYNYGLACLSNYEQIGAGIFRYDYQYAEILPMAIVAAQTTYADNKDQYVKVIEKYTNTLNSPYQNRWELKYFAAQSYLDLYSKTNNNDYLLKAYEIAKNNVNLLVKGQEELNKTYLNDVQQLSFSSSDAEFFSKEELKIQQKELDKLNKSLKEKRKTELPELYEPLIVNCELLFSLADELKIDNIEKDRINRILSGVFIVDPVAEKYSFDTKHSYSIELSEDELIIPANILTSSSTITAVVNTNRETITDFVNKKVERNGTSVSSFLAHFESKTIKTTKWEIGDIVTISVSNGANYDNVIFQYKVKEIKTGFLDIIKGLWGSDKVIFECVS